MGTGLTLAHALVLSFLIWNASSIPNCSVFVRCDNGRRQRSTSVHLFTATESTLTTWLQRD